ncbi:hypothetical protein ETD86_14675 [Nonomuraea turkmeniaca]|uniref:Uncharacterized protein n=1 Tax=Nonomuraea turkmeniaca TaxID=103838 RepID=A0A5S4FLS1_9ACTN|nr:hypothetical protein [Nonomuraea turkmeniaca]TMR21549.1 hypothetical protein ETD86_14675 [Nonomuraea turkmeniaca]
MKRTVVGAAVVAGLALAATPAQAATPKIDPVKALKAELAPGKAVNVLATAKVTYSWRQVVTSELDGTIGFGARGVAASDVAHTQRYSEDLLRQRMKLRPEETEALQQSSTRMISSGDVSYVSGPVVEVALQRADASWVRYDGVALPPSNLLLEVLEPDTLKTLLADRTSSRDGVVKGSITTKKLASVSDAFVERFGSPAKKGRAGKISYTLWLRADGLVERVSAKGVLPVGKASVQVESDTRFMDWGRQVTVLVPLRGDVIDRKSVEDDVPAGVPGLWN